MDSSKQKISNGLKTTSLRAGQLSMVFDSNTGFLRHVRLGDREIVRAIYGAVRDHEWNTIRPRLENLDISSQADSFHISFAASSLQGGIHFDWRCEISGETDRVIYTFEGEAKSTFLKNRVGLCVLHPLLECAGKACTVEHVNGRIENGIFPKFILPDQPFKDIRAIRYEAVPEILAEVRFEERHSRWRTRETGLTVLSRPTALQSVCRNLWKSRRGHGSLIASSFPCPALRDKSNPQFRPRPLGSRFQRHLCSPEPQSVFR